MSHLYKTTVVSLVRINVSTHQLMLTACWFIESEEYDDIVLWALTR